MNKNHRLVERRRGYAVVDNWDYTSPHLTPSQSAQHTCLLATCMPSISLPAHTCHYLCTWIILFRCRNLEASVTHQVTHRRKFYMININIVAIANNCAVALIKTITLFIKFRTYNNVIMITKQNSYFCQVMHLFYIIWLIGHLTCIIY